MRTGRLRSVSVGVLVCCLAIAEFAGGDDSAQAIPKSMWTAVEVRVAVKASNTRWVVPERFELVRLDRTAFSQLLARVPQEQATSVRASDVHVELPMPDGSRARFKVVESPVMAPELAARYPLIQTYLGRGIDDPAASVRFDWTPKGLHAQILSPSGTVYVDPYLRGDNTLYASYYKRDYPRPEGAPGCALHQHDSNIAETSVAATAARSGETLRTYRLALAATGEYTAFHGGTVADGMAAIVTAVNRITGIYENELAVRLVLVPNNDQLVFTNASTDPYNNSNGGAMLGQNQSEIDIAIGSANYDIGHVFSTGGGGVAFLGVVCETGFKAGGVTGLSNPNGDPFYVDYVAHEMGHQFGGNHSFNGISGSCCCGNRNGSTAYEPGSGSTIMAYAGICGGDNLQSNSDAYFHSISLDEIDNYVSNSRGSWCPVTTSTGNGVPTALAGPDYTIPQNTPFVLEGGGSDPDGDPLTYCWEQRDLGPGTTLSTPDNGSIPLLRSFTPASSADRFVPAQGSVIGNSASHGEQLPTTNRTMRFRLTVRDNVAGGGGVDFDEMLVDVIASSGPFSVTSPNTAVVWSGDQTVTWDVAGTDVAPVGAAQVEMSLSIDGGWTFPTVLAAATPNDGSETVTLPDIEAIAARIRVRPIGNIFYDISNVDFQIGACGIAGPPIAESVVLARNRYLALQPGNPAKTTALRVTLTDLPVGFEGAEGTSQWVGQAFLISEQSDEIAGTTPPWFWGARLRTDPHCTDWSQLGTVYIYGEALIPGGTYEVQEVICDCGFTTEDAFSSPLSIDTGIWGDVVGVCSEAGCAGPDGANSFDDISSVVDKFRNLPGAVLKAFVDLAPNVPDNRVDFDDIGEVVNAFRGLPYPFDGP